MAMQLQLSCPLGDSRLVPSRPRPFLSRARRRAMRCDGMGMGMGAASCNQIRPGKRRSISRVFPRVSPTPNSISTTGRTRPPLCVPRHPALLTCTQPCGSERFCLTALPQFWNSCSPLSHTLQHRMEGMALPCCHPKTAGLPTCLPTQPA